MITYDFNKNIKQHNCFIMIMISERSCDTEDWSYGALTSQE